MAILRKWQRTYGQFLANGATPVKATGIQTISVTPGTAHSLSSLRLRTDIEMYVVAQATGTNPINFAFMDEVIMVVGSIVYVGGSELSSQTPLTDLDAPPITGSLGGWGQWEYLYPDLTNVDLNSPELAIVTWRPRQGTIDTQFRRTTTASTGMDLWMPWEIQDGSGLINTTTAGVTYNLGVRFAQSWLSEIRT